MSKKVANSQHYKVGIVTDAQGESLFATNPQGEVRRLSTGSAVYSDDKIESHDGSSMVIQASNGQTINIPEDVYDQMLSSAITKELSTSLNGLQESQDKDTSEPHSNNQSSQPTDHSLNTVETPQGSFLYLNDVLCSEESHSLDAWLNSPTTTFSYYDLAELSSQQYDFSDYQMMDLSTNFIG